MRKKILYEKAVDSINKTEWYRDEKFLSKFPKRNFSETRVKILRSIVEELTDIFEDKFHLEMCLSYDGYGFNIYAVDLIIHYPKLIVTNEKNQSINLTNHFQKVRCFIGEGVCNFDNSMNCITVNPTAQQFLRSYVHSHTSRKSYYNNGFKGFCLGSNTEFKKLNDQLSSNLYDADTFHMFCINLITMAETESLAGKPHIRLATITIGGDLSSDRMPHYLIENYINKYKSSSLKAVDWKVTSGVLEVVDNEKFEQHCLIFEYDVDEYNNIGGIIVCKDSVGNYYMYSNGDRTSELNVESIDWHIQFKDKQYKFGLADGAILKPETFFIHPQIKKHVKKHLEEKANIKLIKESITTKV